MHRLLSIALLVACSGGDKEEPSPTDSPTPTDTGTPTTDTLPTDTGADTSPTDTGTAPPCLNSVVSVFPADGDAHAYFRTTVEFELAQNDAIATVALSGPGGAVAGDVDYVGRRVIFAPDQPLDPATAYTATLTWACDPVTTTFRTSEVGQSLDTDLTGRAYRLALAQGRWLQPPAIGPVIGKLLGADILVGVDATTPTSLDLVFARSLGMGGAQDLCEPTTRFPTADFSASPFFAVGPADVVLNIGTADVLIANMTLSGAFSANGDELAGGTLGGVFDTADLVDELAPGGPDDAVCDILAPFGVNCLPCPTTFANTCVAIQVDAIEGPEDATVTVVERTVQDVLDDPSCP